MNRKASAATSRNLSNPMCSAGVSGAATCFGRTIAVPGGIDRLRFTGCRADWWCRCMRMFPSAGRLKPNCTNHDGVADLYLHCRTRARRSVGAYPAKFMMGSARTSRPCSSTWPGSRRGSIASGRPSGPAGCDGPCRRSTLTTVRRVSAELRPRDSGRARADRRRGLAGQGFRKRSEILCSLLIEPEESRSSKTGDRRFQGASGSAHQRRTARPGLIASGDPDTERRHARAGSGRRRHRHLRGGNLRPASSVFWESASGCWRTGEISPCGGCPAKGPVSPQLFQPEARRVSK